MSTYNKIADSSLQKPIDAIDFASWSASPRDVWKNLQIGLNCQTSLKRNKYDKFGKYVPGWRWKTLWGNSEHEGGSREPKSLWTTSQWMHISESSNNSATGENYTSVLKKWYKIGLLHWRSQNF